MDDEPKYQYVNHDISVEFEAADILDEILDFYESSPDFDATYFKSIKKQALQTRKISAAQYNSMVKVYYDFKMQGEPKQLDLFDET